MRNGKLFFLGLFIVFLSSAYAIDKDLGLHSDGGPWRFYPCAQKDGKLPRVLLIGDSIMNGYRGNVASLLKGKADVDVWLTPLHLNSPDLHPDLQKVMEQGPYDVIHFNIGLHGWTPGRIPEGQYEPLMREYVEILRSHSETVKVIWGSTTQITVKGKPTELDPQHNLTIAVRNEMCEKLMSGYGIVVNDLYGLMSDKLKLARGDKYHWNGQAYKLMAQQISQHVIEALSSSEADMPVYYVSVKGDDSNDGTKQRPFRTLEKARDAVRKVKSKNTSAVIYLREGVYERRSTFELNKQDSGSIQCPVIWRSYPGEDVRIVGGKQIPLAAVKSVTDQNVLARIIEKDARKKVLQVDLKSHGITDFGEIRPHGFRRPYIPAHMELFVDGNAMRLAQWPNPGEPRIPVGKVLDKGSVPRDDDFSNRGGKFHYDTERPEHWKKADNVWIYGFFKFGYADDTVKIKSFDHDKKIIETVHPHMYGFMNWKPWNRWYALNLLEEIDQPGEYYVDRNSGVLYYYPPESFDPKKSDISVSILEVPLVAMEEASYVHFDNITFECTRGMGVYIEGGQGCRLNGCILRNIGMVAVCIGRGTEALEHYAHAGTAVPAGRKLGSWHEHIYDNPAYDRKGGKDHGVVSCDIYNIGSGGISMGGGSRKTLTPAGNFVRNCHIYNFNRLDKTYRAGVNIDGVGNKIEHCLIHDCPNNAVYLHGNDHIIEYNEVHHAVMDADDMGAFYMGRDPSEYGNMIRYNFFHHIGCDKGGHGTQAIFFDDGATGTTVHGNVIYKTSGSALKCHGAIDNIYTNNILIDNKSCDPGDGWGAKRWHNHYGTKTEKGFLNERLRKHVDILEPPYLTNYPELARRYKSDLSDWHGNILQRNVSVRSGAIRQAGEHRKGNWITDKDPGFEDMIRGDFALRSDCEVFERIPGFEPVPFAKMGLYKDMYRHQLPKRIGFEVKEIDLSRVKYPDEIRINYQTIGMQTPSGWHKDHGQVFDIQSEGYAYGWTIDNTSASRKRGKNDDPIKDSLVHFAPGTTWEIAVKKGFYQVEVSLGDSEFNSSDTDLFVEGVTFIENEKLDVNTFRRIVKTVEVTDGKLTLTSNNNPHGPGLTRLNYIQLKKTTKAEVQGIRLERPDVSVCGPYRLIWDTPGSSSFDSMPIGNGDIGLNVWTEQNGDLVFYLSKTDAWSENGRLLKLGKVRVTLSPNPFATGTLFSQELSVKDGQIVIESGQKNNAAKLIVWVDANNPAVNIDIKSKTAVEVKASFEPWRTKRRELTGNETHSAYGVQGKGAKPIFVEPDIVVAGQKDRVVWYHRNERSIWKANLDLQALGNMVAKLKDPLLNRTFGALIEGEGLVSETKTTLRSKKPQNECTISIYPLTAQTGSSKAWLTQVKNNADRIGSVSYVKRMKNHQNWWQRFWDRSYIHVSSTNPKDKSVTEKITRGYILQRWINACGGRGNSPIKFNGSIFTVDTKKHKDKFKGFDADFRQWGGPFWWQNTRLPYWSMLTSGDYDLMAPVFKMYQNVLPIRRAATKKYYGHDGAFIPETMYFWGTYVDANYGRDRKNLPDGLTENRYIRYYWQSGLELSLMMLDYYSHTQDKEFAQNTLLPFAQDIITFFDQHWDRDGRGKIHFEPAMALETYRKAVNPLVEIVGIAKVCDGLLSLPDSMVSRQRTRQWKRLISELPEVPMQAIDGKKVLAPAHKYSEKQNVENPEMYAVFPYRTYGVGKDDIEIARNTFARRVHKNSGGWQQNAIQAAFLGLADEAAKLVSYNFTHKDPRHRFDAMWGPNYDWTPDQDHGSVAMTALQRMLLQYEGEEIYLLPAWPKKWNVEFKLHAPDKTIVECVYKDGQLQQLNTMPSSRKNDIHLDNK